MYVCLCEGVTDGQIRTAVGVGVSSMRQLREQLGVASQCGRCACHAKQLLDECRPRAADRSPEEAARLAA